MSSRERKTRGRQRIPIRLIENKDDLLVSFSKRRVGVYKKVSELSTLCGVDAGAIIFSPSGIPHSFFTPDLDTVVHGRHPRDATPRTTIRGLNKRLDEAIEQLEREEKREKHLAAADMGWWEVPVDAEQVKEQIEWFQALRAQIKTRVQELQSRTADAAGNLPLPPPTHLDPCVAAGFPNYPFNVFAGGYASDQYHYLYPPSPLPAGITHYCLPPQGYGEARPHQN